MIRRLSASLGIRPRGVLVAATLVAHLLGSLGFPLPAPRSPKSASRPFPCQSRACGCQTAEQCWAGDCCCSTIEEKLAWAEAKGVEPPDHVRPLVASRRAAATPKKKSCCCEQEPVSAASCCEKQPATSTCDAKSGNSCCEKKAPAAVTWVVGVFAKKCRGEGPGSPADLDPAVAPNIAPVVIAAAERPRPTRPVSDTPTPVPNSPPTPPPRS